MSTATSTEPSSVASSSPTRLDVEGHRRKVVGMSIASVVALMVKASPLIVGSVLNVYMVWWLYKHARSKKG